MYGFLTLVLGVGTIIGTKLTDPSKKPEYDLAVSADVLFHVMFTGTHYLTFTNAAPFLNYSAFDRQLLC